MKLTKMFRDMNKVFPFKSFVPVIVFFGLIMIYVVIANIFKDVIPNKNYYKLELIGNVENISRLDNSRIYKIGSDWYQIKGRFINDISIGDTIYKEKKSYVFRITNIEGYVKFDKEVKNTIINKIDKRKIMQIE